MHSARHLDSRSHEIAASLRRRGREVWPLLRRDADLGQVVTVHRNLPDARAEAARWRGGEPIFLPGVLGDGPERYAAEIRASLEMFDRLRDGAGFLDEIEARLEDDDTLRYAGSTVDQDDPREIERLFVDAVGPEATPGDPDSAPAIAEDLWAKLAWITAEDPSDESLRIRFSNGLDQLEEWMTTSDHTASWVDQFALRAFPECRALLCCEQLRTRLDRMIARPHRISERIVYNNAPNGGAIFHHDAEPAQLGVVYAQLEGRTAWFSLSKPRLADLLVRVGWRNRRLALAAMDAASDQEMMAVLNRDPAFAALLAAHGGLFLLQAGDAIVLPSPSFDLAAWHSVLAVGDTPSLSHSYGIFARSPDYDPAGDPWLEQEPLSTLSS